MLMLAMNAISPDANLFWKTLNIVKAALSRSVVGEMAGRQVALFLA